MSDGMLDPPGGDDLVDQAVNDTAAVRALLAVESALALGCADAGLVPQADADLVAARCVDLDVDYPALAAGTRAAGNPVLALLTQLRASLPAPACDAVHVGATSQDIIDTALMLLTRQAGTRVLSLLDDAAQATASLAAEHRGTLMVSRTLGRQALPTTFGLTAAGWLGQLDTAADRLSRLLDSGLALQLGGAAGTLAAFGNAGAQVTAAVARRLDLPAPPRPWHTDRQRLLDITLCFGGVVVAFAKIATDVALLASDEVAEVAVGGGSSSAMPHKQNPVDAVLIRAAAVRIPGLTATMFSAAVHEQQRATGAWHAEWPTWRDLLRVTGGAAARGKHLLEQLTADPARMRATLDAAGGRLMAESLTYRLTPLLGGTEARDLIAGIARASAAAGEDFGNAARADPVIGRHLDDASLTAALDPVGWLGSSQSLIDSALASHRARQS